MLNRTYNRAGAGTQLDVTLQPYYERDKAAGILTDEEAQFILACLPCAGRGGYDLAAFLSDSGSGPYGEDVCQSDHPGS